MKTKNAFALSGFDKQRILQRPFFKAFRFGDKTDEEILNTLDAADEDSVATTQMKLDAMVDLLVRVLDYQGHIIRHGNRLTKYARAVEKKIVVDEQSDVVAFRARHKRAHELSMRYCGHIPADGVTTVALGGIAGDDVLILVQRITEGTKALNEKIKAGYLKIFAERLKSIRKEMKMSQAAFGTMLGLSQRGISNFENAIYEPNLATLVRIAERLGRPVGWFLGTN